MGSERHEEVPEMTEMTEMLLMQGGWGHGGPWFLLFPLLWIGLAVAVFLAWRGRPDRRATESAEEILADRYARGEITADEFRERREVLRRRRT
jgi:putative membrane protein